VAVEVGQAVSMCTAGHANGSRQAAIMIVAILCGCLVACDTCDASPSEGSASRGVGEGRAREEDPQVRATVLARDRALEALLREDALGTGEVWALRRVARGAHHDALQGRIPHWIRKLKRDKPEKVAILDPEADRPILPDTLGDGLGRWSTVLAAAYAEPEHRARAFVAEFLAEPGGGYVMTHKLLLLIWWEESRGALPAELARHRDLLVDRMMEEQIAAEAFSDLYAKRAYLLGMYGNACVEDLARWAEVITAAQEEDGTWGELSWTFSYGGRHWNASGVTPPAVHAVGALQAYVEAAQQPSGRCVR
jgi:hypothetical protein